MNKYYGMVDIALNCGIFKKVSTKIELPDGKTVFEKHLLEDPEKYFTKEVMAALEAAVGKQFKYGQPSAEGNE